MEIDFRKVKIEDFEEVFYLFRQLWPAKELNHEELKKVFDRGLKTGSDEYICAEYDKGIIGFCAMAIVNNFWQEGHIGYIYAMIIDEKYRGKGIGTKLLQEAYEAAKVRGCKKLELDSGFHRTEAHKFYEKNGYLKRAFLFSRDVI
ncbi:MAG: acetyltransferase [Eubacterium sp.]|jgi:GNAT superfamily N-acetyltransferase|nr:acetyltransferase [Eubacterium sp.]